MSGRLWSVSAAFANGADVLNWQVVATSEEGEDIARDLAWLSKLGHVATYSAAPSEAPINASAWRDQVTARIGSLVMNSVQGCTLARIEPQPAFLVPVWPFDDDNEYGVLATTARFLNTEAELWAVPSCDDETGFSVPGRAGLYLPQIMPYPNWRTSSVI